MILIDVHVSEINIDLRPYTCNDVYCMSYVINLYNKHAQM